jgi:hypothetical protein
MFEMLSLKLLAKGFYQGHELAPEDFRLLCADDYVLFDISNDDALKMIKAIVTLVFWIMSSKDLLWVLSYSSVLAFNRNMSVSKVSF